MHGAKFNRRQTGGFLQEKITGHAVVGIEELRCTNGADEITTHRQKTTGGSGRIRPNGLALPPAQFPEEQPQKCEAGRDVVQETKFAEIRSSSGGPVVPSPEYYL